MFWSAALAVAESIVVSKAIKDTCGVYEMLTPTRVKAPSKCGGCGSRYFVQHHNTKVCGYCRGEQ